jgi:hypothetical protein
MGAEIVPLEIDGCDTLLIAKRDLMRNDSAIIEIPVRSDVALSWE